jgi:hypothetical protein
MSKHTKLDEILATTERISVVGSPSTTTELALDILGAAVGRKLVGELAILPFSQDSAAHYALGQITEVKLRNIWHEDPTMRSLIRQRGKVDAISERQDTHQGDMTVSAVFAATPKGYEPSILGTVPATGTNIHLVNDDVLDEVLSPYRNQLFYLGNVYGSKPKLPLWFKHFAQGPDGAGEAYHLGIFGKTGSGKSVPAKMILTAYARYPGMALLVIDPQGEFAKDMKKGGGYRGISTPVGGHHQRAWKAKSCFHCPKTCPRPVGTLPGNPWRIGLFQGVADNDRRQNCPGLRTIDRGTQKESDIDLPAYARIIRQGMGAIGG